MMSTLRVFIEKQRENKEKLSDEVRFMVVNKDDLSVIASFNKNTIPEDLPEETLNKGIESIGPNKKLQCIEVVVVDMPESEEPDMYNYF